MLQAKAMLSPSLKEVFVSVCRFKHLSLNTERSYWNYIRRFYAFHNKRHLREMGVPEIRQFLMHLAVNDRVTASTQNAALCALLFLYREVYKVELPYISEIKWASRPPRIPVIFNRDEVEAILKQLERTPRLVASLLYGSGLRLMEALRLRIKDVDLVSNQLIVRDGKGQKDRRTMLPLTIRPLLQAQVERARAIHEADRRGAYPA